MKNLSHVMRRALEEHDAETAWKLWAQEFPHLPQPKSMTEASIVMHHACTQSRTATLNARSYSHRWLLDHGYPSGLPDKLKPKAERMYPKIVDAIGIAAGAVSEAMKPAIPIIRGAMEEVVLDHYASGIRDPLIIKPRMLEARKDAVKKLLGR